MTSEFAAKIMLIAGGLFGLLSVLLGAFAAHGLSHMADWGFLSDLPRPGAVAQWPMAAQQRAADPKNCRNALLCWYVGLQWQHLCTGPNVRYLAWPCDAAGWPLFDQRLAVSVLGRS